MTATAILLFFVGLILVILSSNYLVDGASFIARRSGISEFVIGLTIVGIGTSTPEMVVSLLSAIRGNADMAIGNVIGSNIFNTCMILGLTAVILPMTITRSTVRRDIPFNILVTVLLILLGMNHSITGLGQEDTLSRIDGLLLLLGFVVYMILSFRDSKAGSEETPAEENGSLPRLRSVWAATVMVALSLAGLIFGGRLFVDNAALIARSLGWSDKFIGITVLAAGTSFPELATCIVAAIKKKGQLALGNIIGSNIANICLILGCSALIHPLKMNNITLVDLGFVLLSAVYLLCANFMLGRKKLGRCEGIILLLLEAIYMYILISAL